MSSALPIGIVGGGPSGLATARRLAERGVAFEVLERHSDLGGIWDMANPGTPLYATTHFISSKNVSGFPDFPMPDEFPDYPGHALILRYLRDFADRCGLRRFIRFNADAMRAWQEGDGTWSVALRDGESRSYSALICANGVTWKPNVPAIPGIFDGEVRHSNTYRDPAEFGGKRVLVVGGGNSGVDIASDAARTASAAFLSLRRGYRFVPKHIFGRPFADFIRDGGLDTLPSWMGAPSSMAELLDGLVGDVTRLGLQAPDHDAFSSHPIMNTRVLDHIAHGELYPKRDVERFDHDQVVFVDGSREAVDLVILATGYEHAVPYLHAPALAFEGGRPALYLNIFPPGIENLYFVGFVEFAAGAYPQLDAMARLVAEVIGVGEARRGRVRDLMATYRPDLRAGRSFVNSDRHANYVDLAAYRLALKEAQARLSRG